MTPTEFISVLILFGAIWYWLDGMRTKEIARQQGRHACNKAEVNFLDDTVAIKKVRLCRDGQGKLTIYREYQFEFASDGANRYRGEIIILGKKVKSIYLDPYRIPRDRDLLE